MSANCKILCYEYSLFKCTIQAILVNPVQILCGLCSKLNFYKGDLIAYIVIKQMIKLKISY
jgi:hypothetical protein